MYTVVLGKMEKAAFSPIYPWYTPTPTIVYLFTLPSYCPLLVGNGSIDSAQIIPPPEYAELLPKLLVPVKSKVATCEYSNTTLLYNTLHQFQTSITCSQATPTTQKVNMVEHCSIEIVVSDQLCWRSAKILSKVRRVWGQDYLIYYLLTV